MTSVTKPLVSIIIPTYNREHILSGAIESAIHQTYPNKQIIVVDDGSVDKTRELVARYSQVEYYFQKNSGQGKARNTGLYHAKGSYVASLDSDDAWHPEFLERCIQQLEKGNIGFVFANWTQVDNKAKAYDNFSQTKMLGDYINSSKKPWISLENSKLRNIYLEGCPSPSSSIVFKRESMFENWNEHLHIADDWCLLLDMILLKECNAAFTTEKLWVKRTDGQNIYDGRDSIEVLEHLYISDYSAIIERHRHLLKKEELRSLNKKISRYIFQLYLNKLFHLKLTVRYTNLFLLALNSNPFIFVDVFLRFIFRNLKKILIK
jgi:glycosyltransferase involved in cell wall biosynthesis